MWALMLKHIKKYISSLDSLVGYGTTKLKEPTDEKPANVNISKLEDQDDTHSIMLDIDAQCELIPSKTAGHYHLYIDKRLSWKAYLKLLDALVEAGIVEEGWVMAARKSGATILRLPPAEYEFKKIKEQLEETGEMFHA